MQLKKLARNIVCRILEKQATRLREQHDFKLVAVAGSLGKTSTKLAIATVLGQGRRVLFQEGNYNDRVTVPLVLFEQSLPNLLNVAAWLRIFYRNRQLIKGEYPYDCVVVELGTDGPGQLAEFAYLKPDITVVTAIAPEHMEFFGSLEAVAHEELSVARFSQKLLINLDNVPSGFLKNVDFISYGLRGADYLVEASIIKLAQTSIEVSLRIPGKQGELIALAAAAVADQLGLSIDQIKAGVNTIEPFAGRLRLLAGLKNSTLIDDSYNASPVAVIAGLDVLYATKAPQKIAILGSMNELGDYSPEAHKVVAEHCDPNKVDLVVTIGADANQYLAPVAEKQGCKIATFDNPYDAGRFVKEHLHEAAAVLAEGSQNGVFAEEALKILLANPADVSKLVRQSEHWLNVKKQQFPKQ